MEELAQSVGNENIPGDFDWDAATAVDPNTNDAGPFQHLVDSNPALGREEALSQSHRESHSFPSGLAACIGVTESLICQIHDQTVALLRNHLWRVSKPVSACFSQESELVFLHRRRSTPAKK